MMKEKKEKKKKKKMAALGAPGTTTTTGTGADGATGAKGKRTKKKSRNRRTDTAMSNNISKNKRASPSKKGGHSGAEATSTEDLKGRFKVELLQLFDCANQKKAKMPKKSSGGKSGLARKKLVLLGDDDIFEISSILTKPECRAVIEMAEHTGFELTDQRETRYAARRRNGRIAVDAPELATRLWSRCRSFFGEKAVGLSPNFRFYKYERGDSFGMHVDDSVDHGNSSRSMYTLLIYLNASPDVFGGATVFYKGSTPAKAKEVLRFEPKEGSALAHIHGPRCMLHEGSAVENGVKYLMRTDVVYQY